jgi:hypothetical protein
LDTVKPSETREIRIAVTPPNLTTLTPDVPIRG